MWTISKHPVELQVLFLRSSSFKHNQIGGLVLFLCKPRMRKAPRVAELRTFLLTTSINLQRFNNLN